MIRSTWSEHNFTKDRAVDSFIVIAEEGSRRAVTLDFQFMTAAIRSAQFGSWLHAMRLLHWIGHSARAWCEMCPCHTLYSQLEEGDAVEYLIHVKQMLIIHEDCPKDAEGAACECPLKGKRAWQIFVGEFDSFMDELFFAS